MQGLFARVGSGDPVRVLRLFHNNYTGYCCIHLLCRATYNLSLPRLSAKYYGLPMTVQLRAAHKSRCSLVGVSRSTALQVLYCTCLERYNYGTVQEYTVKSIHVVCWKAVFSVESVYQSSCIHSMRYGKGPLLLSKITGFLLKDASADQTEGWGYSGSVPLSVQFLSFPCKNIVKQ